MEVIDHDLGLEFNRVIAALDEAPQFLLGLLDVELWVLLHCFGELVIALYWHVVGEHVEDEPLLDRLLHGVAVEGVVPDCAIGLWGWGTEDFQRLVLGGGGEGEVAGVGEQLARLHQAIDPVLEGFFLLFCTCLGECLRHGGTRAAALAGVGLVDDDGEAASALLVADFVEDEGEFLDRRDDDLLAALDEPAQVARAVGVSHRCRHLGILPDRVADLPVEDEAVGDDED